MVTKFGKDRDILVYKNGIIIGVYKFSYEASIATEVSRSSISNNLCGISKSAGGYIFKYSE